MMPLSAFSSQKCTPLNLLLGRLITPCCLNNFCLIFCHSDILHSIILLYFLRRSYHYQKVSYLLIIFLICLSPTPSFRTETPENRALFSTIHCSVPRPRMCLAKVLGNFDINQRLTVQWRNRQSYPM